VKQGGQLVVKYTLFVVALLLESITSNSGARTTVVYVLTQYVTNLKRKGVKDQNNLKKNHF